VELRHRLVRRVPRRMLEGAGDVSFTVDSHVAGAFLGNRTISVSGATSNTLHRSLFLPVTTGARRYCGKTGRGQR
jgi:hypothetical protein